MSNHILASCNAFLEHSYVEVRIIQLQTSYDRRPIGRRGFGFFFWVGGGVLKCQILAFNYRGKILYGGYSCLQQIVALLHKRNSLQIVATHNDMRSDTKRPK